MMATAHPISPALLKRGITHVCYEYANLISAAHHDMHGQAPWRTHCDDAFLLGYRKMRDFLLLNKRPKPKDILASDYLPAGFKRTWHLPTWEAEWRLEMDKQLAHISFEREKEWNHTKWVPKLESEMRTAWAEFLKAIADPHKAEFAAQIAHCQAKPGFAAVTI